MLRTSYFAEVEENDREHDGGRNSLAVEVERVRKLRIVMAPWPGCC